MPTGQRDPLLDQLDAAIGSTPTRRDPLLDDLDAAIGTRPSAPSRTTVNRNTWDLRPDGTRKGDGYLGTLVRPDGTGVMGEYSIADSEKIRGPKGEYLDYPTLVPTLTKAEVQTILNLKPGEAVPDSIKQKAEAHALERISKGQSVWAQRGEQRLDLFPDLERATVVSEPMQADGFTDPRSVRVTEPPAPPAPPQGRTPVAGRGTGLDVRNLPTLPSMPGVPLDPNRAPIAARGTAPTPAPRRTADIDLPAAPVAAQPPQPSPEQLFQQKVDLLQQQMAAAGHPVVITSKRRTAEQQARLFAQGRGAAGPIVTEKSGKPGDESLHQLGLAVDIAFVGKDGKPDYSETQPWAALGQTAKDLGLEWGGDWTTLKDRPHVQLPAQARTVAAAPPVPPAAPARTPMTVTPMPDSLPPEVVAPQPKALDVPIHPIEGAKQLARGAATLGRDGMFNGATEVPVVAAASPSPEQARRTKAALSDVIEGTFGVLSPLIPAALIAAPVTAAIALGVAAGADQAARDAVKLAGGDEESQRLAGNIAAALAAGVGTDYIIRQTKADIAALAERGRNARAPREAARMTPDPSDIETQPVGQRALPPYQQRITGFETPDDGLGRPVSPEPPPTPPGAPSSDPLVNAIDDAISPDTYVRTQQDTIRAEPSTEVGEVDDPLVKAINDAIDPPTPPKKDATQPYEQDVVHVTTPDAADAILRSGYDVSKAGSGLGGDTYGPGVYLADSATDGAGFWREQLRTKNESGEVPTTALGGRVRLQNPLVIEDMKPVSGPYGAGLMQPLDRRDIVQQRMPDRLARFDALVKDRDGSKNEALGQVAREAGYDGLVFQRRAGEEIVAFDPKAVTFTRRDGKPITVPVKDDDDDKTASTPARTPSLALRVGDSTDLRAVSSWEEAGRLADALRDAHERETGEGVSSFPPITIVDTTTGNTVARVSYNGRIWDAETDQEIERNDGRGYGKAPAIESSATSGPEAQPPSLEALEAEARARGASDEDVEILRDEYRRRQVFKVGDAVTAFGARGIVTGQLEGHYLVKLPGYDTPRPIDPRDLSPVTVEATTPLDAARAELERARAKVDQIVAAIDKDARENHVGQMWGGKGPEAASLAVLEGNEAYRTARDAYKAAQAKVERLEREQKRAESHPRARRAAKDVAFINKQMDIIDYGGSVGEDHRGPGPDHAQVDRAVERLKGRVSSATITGNRYEVQLSPHVRVTGPWSEKGGASGAAMAYFDGKAWQPVTGVEEPRLQEFADLALQDATPAPAAPDLPNPNPEPTPAPTKPVAEMSDAELADAALAELFGGQPAAPAKAEPPKATTTIRTITIDRRNGTVAETTSEEPTTPPAAPADDAAAQKRALLAKLKARQQGRSDFMLRPGVRFPELGTLQHGRFGGREILYFPGDMPEADILALAQNPAFVRVAHAVLDVAQDFLAAMPGADEPNHPALPARRTPTQVGLIFTWGSGGVNIAQEVRRRPNDENFIGFNVLDLLAIERRPDNIAAGMRHVIEHEITHNYASGEGDNFTYVLGAVIARIGTKRALQASRTLKGAYGGWRFGIGPNRLANGLADALQRYENSGRRGVRAAGSGRGTLSYSKRPTDSGGPEGGTPEGTGRDRADAPVNREDVVTMVALVRLYLSEGTTAFGDVWRQFEADAAAEGIKTAPLAPVFEVVWRMLRNETRRIADIATGTEQTDNVHGDATSGEGAHGEDGTRPEQDGALAGSQEGAPDTVRSGSGSTPDGDGGEGTPDDRGGQDESGSGAGADSGGAVRGGGSRRGGRRAPKRLTTATEPDLYQIDPARIGTGSARERVQRNFAAIRIVKTLEQEQRPATPEERDVLVQYVGWGGLPRIFEYWKFGEPGEARGEEKFWQEAHFTLKELLTDAEFRAASNSTQNAHYTSPMVIQTMWDAVRRLGVTHGSILEPAAGIGHFVGLAPAAFRGQPFALVEKDETSAAIIKALYPGAYVQHQPFEKAALPDNHFAVVISNIPFGDIPITDPEFTGPPKVRQRIHNYFFGKALDKVAPGGLVAFVTTHASLDTRDNDIARRYVAGKADFLGAIRLPFTAFKGNAGTEVITDLVFLRKRHEGEEPKHVAPWLETTAVTLKDKDGNDVQHYVNEYFQAHPEMVLGTQDASGKMRGKGGYNVVPPGEKDSERMAHWQAHGADEIAAAIRRLPSKVIDLTPPTETLDSFAQSQAPEGSRPFEYLIHEGELAQVNEHGIAVRKQATKADDARIRGLLPVRTALRAVYDQMAADASDADVTAAQQALTTAYDTFVKKHGPISLAANFQAFREDPDLPLLLSLEEFDEEKQTATKTAIFTKRTVRAERKARTADSPEAALLIALGETGRIDLDRIGELLGIEADAAARQLADAALIIDTPQGWQLPAVYLSGNVRVKLAEATAAAAMDDRYTPAVERLTAVIPEDLTGYKINVRLGASWVPPERVQEFVASIAAGADQWHVRYNPHLAVWDIEGPPTAHQSRFETPDVATKTLLLDALNDRRRTIKKTIGSGADRRTVVDIAATQLARQRKEDLHKAFSSWLLRDDLDRKKWAVRTYNDLFNSYVEPKIDGSFLTFPGMADFWREKMADHQRHAVARTLLFGNTLFAHVVGAGKTLEMVGALMERRRLGLARKPMMVVPNHLISQAPAEFLMYYPNAKVLVVTTEDLDEANRKRFTARVAAGDYDAVIAPYSVFVRLSMSAEAETTYQNELLDEIETAIVEEWARINAEEADTSSARGSRRGRSGQRKTPPSIKNLEKMRDKIRARLDALAARPKDDLLTFEQLGVDALAIDEAHSFKNLYFPTRQQAAGLPSNSDAQRAADLYMKARYINKLSNHRNLILATGTPVSNSMAEIFVLQKFLQEHALERAGIDRFDAWLAQFGQIVIETELDASGTGMKARPTLKNFRNLPDLAAMFRQVSDVKMIDDLPWLKARRPKLRGGEPQIIEVPLTDEQSRLLEELQHRAQHLDPRNRRADNMPKITGDGRMGMLDMRLLDRRTPDNPGNKMHAVAREVSAIYKQFKDVRGTQLVFLDSGTPGSEERSARQRKDYDANGNKITRPPTEQERHRGFDLYTDLKKKLVKAGVRQNEIAFIHDIDELPEKKQDAARKALFRKVNSGEIRVLIGSTGKMGTGMNVQERLVALHNVDPAWKPSDIEQRNGRILRQGNKLKEGDPDFEVRILNYITTGRNMQFGFDAYMWSLNARKANIVARFFAGDLTERDLSLDLNQTVLTASEMMAVATGNPLMIDYTKVQAEVDRLEDVRRGWEDGRREAEHEIGYFRDLLENDKAESTRAKKTADAITPKAEDSANATATIDRQDVTGHTKIGEAIIEAAKQLTTARETTPAYWPVGQDRRLLGSYRGLVVYLEGNSSDQPTIGLRHPDHEVRTNERRFHVSESRDFLSVTVDLLVPNMDGPGGLGWAHPTGLMTRVNNAIEMIERSAKDTSSYYKNRVSQYEAILNSPFEQQEDLDKARARLEELRQQLGLNDDRDEQQGGEIGDDDDGGGGDEGDGGEGGDTPPAASRSGGGRSGGVQSAVIPGAREFVEQDVLPTIQAAAEQIRRTGADLQILFSPSHVSTAAEYGVGAIRANLAAKAQRIQRAQKLLRSVEKAMDRWSHDQSMQFWDAMESGDYAALDADTRAIAVRYRAIFDAKRQEVQRRGKLQQYIEHYWTHEWKQPNEAANAVRRLFGKRPLQGPKSFLKKRSIPTTREGIEMGLEPVSWNPTTQMLRKLVEMEKWIAAHDILRDLKRLGLAKFIPAGTRPEGEIDHWVRYAESFGTVYKPPVVKVKEAYDPELMDGLAALAAALQTPTSRRPNIGGRRWGYYDTLDGVVTRFGGPETVLMHEIGHAIDERFDLQGRMGLHAHPFSRQAAANPIQKELRALADLRADGEASDSYKKYIRKREEKVANLVHAFIYNPRMAKKVAPNAYKKLEALAREHAVLKPLLELQKTRSLKLGVNTAEIPVGGTVIAGYYFGPPDVVRLINNYLSPGLRGNAAFDLYRTAGNFMNQVQLGLSAFHMAMTGMESVASKASTALVALSRGQMRDAAKLLAQVPVAPLADLVRGHKALKAFYASDANAKVIDGIIGQVVAAGGGFGWDLFEHTGAPERFMQALRSGNYPGALFRAVPALVELQAKPIMEFWVPRLKMAAFLDMARTELRTLGPQPHPDEVRRVLGKVWDSVDNRFGELRYDNLFWHNALKDIGMGSFRALGWNLGSVREALGAPIAQGQRLGILPAAGGGGGGKRPTRLVNTGVDDEGRPKYTRKPDPLLDHKMAWFLATLLAYGTAGAILMYLMTGKRPESLKDYYFPRTGRKNPDGTDERISIAGYPKDWYAFVEHPVDTVTHKLHPLLTMIAEVLNNEDFYGTEIRNPDDPWVEQVKELMAYVGDEFKPISVRNFGETGRVANFFGVTNAPASVNRTAAEGTLHDVLAGRGHMTTTREQAERRDIRRDLRNGDITPQEARETGKLTGQQVRRTMRDSHLSYLQRGFKSLTIQEALDVYEDATPQERAQLFPELRTKARNLQIPAAEKGAVLRRLAAAGKLERQARAAAR